MAFGQIVHNADLRLREWLESQKFQPGSRLPSERSLAGALKMQHYAVNRAMARLIAEGMVERRGYKLFYNAADKAPSGARLRCSLVIVKRSAHLASYRRVAKQLGIDLRLHTWLSMEEAIGILRLLKDSDSEAVVLDPPLSDSVSLWQSAASKLAEKGVPVVCINQHASNISSVHGNNERGLELVVDHFLELGHSEMAFLTISPRTGMTFDIYLQWQKLCQKNHLASSAERVFLHNDSRFSIENARRLSLQLSREWSKVTALAVFMGAEYPVQQLIDELAHQGIGIPEKLSLAFVGDFRPLQLSTPPVTVADTDIALLHEMAFLIAGRAVRKRKEFGIAAQPCDVRIEPHLIRRESTAARSPGRRHEQAVFHEEDPSSLLPPKSFSDRPEELEKIRRQPYERTRTVSEARFATIDLGEYVNRPLNFRRGWMGDLPLKCLEPGLHKLHGVPFNVLGGRNRSDCGVVVFQSFLNTTGNARKLPTLLRIEINQKVSAIYFLHGCGYAKQLQKFATYTFYAGKRRLAEVPLVALGQLPPDITQQGFDEALAKANIQDWWPDYPQYDFPHSRVVPLLESESPEAVHRHVFLYTLEWINPSPNSKVTHLTIKAETEQSTTLGLLAVSLLKPSGN